MANFGERYVSLRGLLKNNKRELSLPFIMRQIRLASAGSTFFPADLAHVAAP